MLYLLAENTIAPFGERVSTALINLVLGMVVVFAVLTVLFLAIKLSGSIFVRKDKKNAAKALAEQKPVAEPVAVEETQDDSEIVAAITAAISLCLEGEGETVPSFRVVSFRKTNSKSSWNNK